MKKNTAGQKIGAQMVSATDGSAFTGSVTVYVTGDAGTQAVGSVGSGACAHEGNGYHTYAPAQAETNYDLIAFTFIGTGAIPATVQVFTNFPQTGDAFARLGANGAGLTALPWPAAWDAEIQSEVQDAIEANHLDHLLAAAYDPASKPGNASALLNVIVENDGGVPRYTSNSLELAPTGGSAPTVAQIADGVWDEAMSGHTSAGSAGKALGDVLDDTGTSGVAVSTTGVAAIWAAVMEGSITAIQAVRLFLSVMTGKSSGGGGSTIVFRDMADSKNRISATVDANGNRTAVGTRDGS